MGKVYAHQDRVYADLDEVYAYRRPIYTPRDNTSVPNQRNMTVSTTFAIPNIATGEQVGDQKVESFTKEAKAALKGNLSASVLLKSAAQFGKHS